MFDLMYQLPSIDKNFVSSNGGHTGLMCAVMRNYRDALASSRKMAADSTVDVCIKDNHGDRASVWAQDPSVRQTLLTRENAECP
jgi:hypothetical protein